MNDISALERLKNLSWIKVYDNYDDPQLIKRNLERNRESAKENEKYLQWIKSTPQELVDEYNNWREELEADEYVDSDTIPSYDEYIDLMFNNCSLEPLLPEEMIKARFVTFENEEDEGDRVVLDFFWKTVKLFSTRGVHFGDEPPNRNSLTFTEMEAFLDYIKEVEGESIDEYIL